MRPLLSTLLLILLLTASGCEPPKIVVTGKVSLKQGKPLPGGMVIFSPVAGGLQGGARGYLMEDGTFTLSTGKEGDGAWSGKYQVLVVGPSKKGGEDAPAAPEYFDRKYSDFATSGLEVEITPEKHHFEFTLDPPAGRK